MKYLFSILVVLGLSQRSWSQDTLHISVLTNVKKDAIQLRWAVNSPMAWKQTNKYGYRLERYTVVRNNEMLAAPEKVDLGVIKPQPLDNWEALATVNGYAAIIAQAIYGQDFQLSGDDSKGVSKFMAIAQELEQRYMVSMYAADLCYPAALLAGWGFEDRNIKENERYLYRVYSLVPVNVLRIATGAAYVTLGEFQPLPQPQELNAMFGDKTVMLSWNYGILSNTYNAYYVEKSYDGKKFTRLSDVPLMNMNSQDGKPADRMYHIDSLADNAVKAYYRIIGVTAFSEEGPPSELVSGQGKAMLIYVPHINRAIPNETGGVDIEWEFDKRGNATLQSFELQLADNDKGPFLPVVSGISRDLRNITYDKTQASNYFVIAAIPIDGEPVMSFPVLVQPVDSIPPAVPRGLVGTVDTVGIVKLSWTANTDSDLLGYRIYRGQTREEELIPLNDVAVRENSFFDTIEVRNLNSKVYYAITAVDLRYNQSSKSATVELLKPEMVPPSPPVITHYRVSDGGISLEWVTGMEENLAIVNLYRSDKATNENKVIGSFNLSVLQHTDNSIEPGKTYAYTLTAVTALGTVSDPSPSVTIQSPLKPGEKGKISDFTAKVNRKRKLVELQWKHDTPGVKHFELYKGETGKPITLWRVVKAYELKLEDEDVSHGHEYEYIIRTILDNGKSGATARVKLQTKM